MEYYTDNFRRCFALKVKCRRCCIMIGDRHLPNPRNYIFCVSHGGYKHSNICSRRIDHLSTCDHRIDHLRCHGIKKDGLRCRLVFNMITKQNHKVFTTKQYCFLHEESHRIQGKSCWVISLSDSNEGGIFTSLGKAEDFAENLQKIHNKLITLRLYTNFKEEYYLTKDLSSLKIIDLIDLINDFIGKNYVWIVSEPLTVIDFDYICKNGETKHSVKINEPFKF